MVREVRDLDSVLLVARIVDAFAAGFASAFAAGFASAFAFDAGFASAFDADARPRCSGGCRAVG